MKATNSSKSFSLSSINWTAAAVNRYYFCSAKIKRAEALNQSYSSVQKWYREFFRAEDHMRAMGI